MKPRALIPIALLLLAAAATVIYVRGVDVVVKFAFALFTLVLAVGVVTIFRYMGKFPSELDRVASDLSLYGYGVGLSFVFGIELGRPVLHRLDRPTLVLVIAVALIATLAIYCITLYLSRAIRELDRFRFAEGIEDLDGLRWVLDNPAGRKYIAWSLSVGFLPTLALIILDIFGG